MIVLLSLTVSRRLFNRVVLRDRRQKTIAKSLNNQCGEAPILKYGKIKSRQLLVAFMLPQCHQVFQLSAL